MRFLVIVAALAGVQAQTYDLLLKGGRVIDPKNEVDAVRDVAIRGGRIAAVSESIRNLRPGRPCGSRVCTSRPA